MKNIRKCKRSNGNRTHANQYLPFIYIIHNIPKSFPLIILLSRSRSREFVIRFICSAVLCCLQTNLRSAVAFQVFAFSLIPDSKHRPLLFSDRIYDSFLCYYTSRNYYKPHYRGRNEFSNRECDSCGSDYTILLPVYPSTLSNKWKSAIWRDHNGPYRW